MLDIVVSIVISQDFVAMAWILHSPSPSSLDISALKSCRIDLPRLPDFARESFRLDDKLRGSARKHVKRIADEKTYDNENEQLLHLPSKKRPNGCIAVWR